MSDHSTGNTLEWVSVVYSTAGKGASVTVTRRRENVTARWTVRASSTGIGSAVKTARASADAALLQVLDAAETATLKGLEATG